MGISLPKELGVAQHIRAAKKKGKFLSNCSSCIPSHLPNSSLFYQKKIIFIHLQTVFGAERL